MLVFDPDAQARRRHVWTVRWFGTTDRRYSKDFKTKKLADRYLTVRPEDMASANRVLNEILEVRKSE